MKKSCELTRVDVVCDTEFCTYRKTISAPWGRFWGFRCPHCGVLMVTSWDVLKLWLIAVSARIINLFCGPVEDDERRYTVKLNTRGGDREPGESEGEGNKHG